jgi:hypothetical protein
MKHFARTAQVVPLLKDKIVTIITAERGESTLTRYGKENS